MLGTDHTDVGADLALNWSLPESLVETIKYHHDPENAVKHYELVHIVYLADLLMSRFHTGLELERLDTESLSARLGAVGFSISEFSELVDHIPMKVLETSPEAALMG